MDPDEMYDLRPPGTTPESFTTAATRAPQNTTPSTENDLRRCVACGEDTPLLQVARCPCSLEYCQGCLIELFRLSTVDESFYPPRCCRKPIVLWMTQIFLPSDLVRVIREKRIEYSTLDRTYCHEPSCSAFINPATSIGLDEATCPKCERKTCTLCKAAYHQGEDCPRDTGTLEVLAIATEKGWQRCSTCRRLIELDTGCFHMSTCSRSSHLCMNQNTNQGLQHSSLPLPHGILLLVWCRVEELRVSSLGRGTTR